MIEKIHEKVWKLSFKFFGSLCYLVKLTNNYLLIDTSSSRNKEELLSDLKSIQVPLNKVTVLLTHLHWDHVGCLTPFKKIYASKIEIEDFNKDPSAALAAYSREELEEVKKSNLLPFSKLDKEIKKEIQVIIAPGHSRGSVAFYMPKQQVLFPGDVVFSEDGSVIGRYDLPTSVPEKVQESIDKVLKLKFKVFCPGH
ncbi:MAG: MBL fold metallo-hydrolase [archaeon]|nr:MAG: MBL fold metallo-hydrolase [archaeon]